MDTARQKYSGHIPQLDMRWRLRMAREDAHLEQIHLANLAGISPRSVVNYEKGYTKPRWPVLLAWADATGADPIWLRDGVTPCPSCGQPTDPTHQGTEESTAAQNRCSEQTPSVIDLFTKRMERSARNTPLVSPLI